MRLDHREDAVSCFVESVKQKPYNWSCWSQMAQLVDATDMVSSCRLATLEGKRS
jgi:anaphase-promoting complex subunit 8